MEEDMTPLPVNSEAKTMSFYDALNRIREGNVVARISWGVDDYCLLKDGFLHIHTKGNTVRWLINDGDMDGNDWIIIESK